MKILKLEADNFKRLVAVEIEPTGELVQITGPNGAGKTSVLDAIWAALGGAKHIQAVPIRQGQTRARVRLDLGELVVERQFSAASGSTLVVSSAKGARYKSPQTILDALLGALTFDPLAFVNMDAREQAATLRGLVTLDVDPDELDGLNRRDFETRTEVNREAKTLRAQADGLAVPEDLPDAAIDTQVLLEELDGAAKGNATIETRRLKREQAARDVQGMLERAAQDREEAHRLRAEATRIEERASATARQADELRLKLEQAEPLPEPVDTSAIRVRIREAEACNRGVELRARRRTLLEQAETAEARSRALTQAMEDREARKVAALAAAQMPVEGLGLQDGHVTYQGLPFDQASSAEQLRVSVALAMATNPRLRVIRIREGSLLDSHGLALIAELARARDYQVWLEKVSDSGKIGVYIEDGRVRAVDGVELPGVTS